MPQILTVPTLSRFSVSVLSNHSASHTSCHVLYRVISSVPTAPSLPPGNPVLSVYIPPVRLRISLLFDFICSDTHIQSIRLRTSISVSYKSVSERIFAHSRTTTFSPYRSLYHSPYLLISNARFGRFLTCSARSRALDRSTIDCTCSLPK